MTRDYLNDFSRSVLAGLFAGLVATAANIAFSIIFRSATHFYDYYALDITVLVFGSILQSIGCGLVFYLFIHYLRKGMPMYRIAVVVITAVIMYVGIMLRKSLQAEVPGDFIILVMGTQFIIGGLAIFYIPYLYGHRNVVI